MIFHITTYDLFIPYIEEDFYETPSLKKEGFIHCSTKEQLKDTIKRYYAHEEMVIVFHIDEAKLTSPLKYEMAASVNEEFPHIYGQLNKDAIAKMERIKIKTYLK
jgi:uncharacterized protein (DUF952 family)